MSATERRQNAACQSRRLATDSWTVYIHKLICTSYCSGHGLLYRPTSYYTGGFDEWVSDVLHAHTTNNTQSIGTLSAIAPEHGQPQN